MVSDLPHAHIITQFGEVLPYLSKVPAKRLNLPVLECTLSYLFNAMIDCNNLIYPWNIYFNLFAKGHSFKPITVMKTCSFNAAVLCQAKLCSSCLNSAV